MLPQVDEWVDQQHALDSKHGINIVIRDFIDDAFTKTVINKNLQ